MMPKGNLPPFIFSVQCPLEERMVPTLVFLLGESYGQRSLEGCSPWGCKERNRVEQLTQAQC